MRPQWLATAALLGIVAAIAVHFGIRDARKPPREVAQSSEETTVQAAGAQRPDHEGIAPNRNAPASDLTPDADYDPTALIFTRRATPRETFEREARSASWASTYEGILARRIEEHLPSASTDLELKNIECRSGCCRIVIDAPAAIADDVVVLNYPVMGMGDIVSVGESLVGEDGGVEIPYVACFKPEHRDPRAYEAWLPGNLEAQRTKVEGATGRKIPAQDE